MSPLWIELVLPMPKQLFIINSLPWNLSLNTALQYMYNVCKYKIHLYQL